MKFSILLFSLVVSFSSTWAAGPIVSGGSPPAFGAWSKMKMRAVLDAIASGGEAVQAIEAKTGNDFIVTLRNSNCFRREHYQVKSISRPSHGPLPILEFKATLVGADGGIVCE